MRTIKNITVVAITLAVATISLLAMTPIASAHAAGAGHIGDQLAEVRAATAKFHDIGVANLRSLHVAKQV